MRYRGQIILLTTGQNGTVSIFNAIGSCIWEINTLRPRQNGRHFSDNIFNCIFLNENVWISNDISLKFVPKCQINNITVLVQIMAWRRPGKKLLSETMMVSLLTHLCVTRPQWVNEVSKLDSNFNFPPTCYPTSHWSRTIVIGNTWGPIN